MSRVPLLSALALASALLLGGCGGDEDRADAGAGASGGTRASGDARTPRPVAAAEPVYEEGSPEAQRAEIDAVLRDNAHDPRVVFDREVTLAFQKLRSERRICAMNPEGPARDECNARARQAYEADKAAAARRRDDALAASPPLE